jgi:hypothetical protein
MKTPVVQAQQRWEYMTLVRKTEPTLVNDINPLGQQGWELVTAMHTQDKKGEPCWVAFLKRPSAAPVKAAAMDSPAAAASGPAARPTVPAAGGTRHAINPPGFDLDGDTFDIKKE